MFDSVSLSAVGNSWDNVAVDRPNIETRLQEIAYGDSSLNSRPNQGPVNHSSKIDNIDGTSRV